MIASSILRIFSLLFVSAFILAGDSLASDEAECGGFLYRVKRDGVPVYELPDVTSEVLKKLNLGDKVCYIGERDKFAIVEWEKKKTDETGDGVIGTAFVKRTDLWESRKRGKGVPGPPASSGGFFDHIRSYLNYMRHGVVPDMPLIPYDPTTK